MWLGADLNGHIGEGADGYGNNIMKFGVGVWNEEGEKILEFIVTNILAVTNTYFKKRESRRITYTSGDLNTQVDYVIHRKSE